MTDIKPKPMDPERLARARSMLAHVVPHGVVSEAFAAELLADRDHHAAEAAQLNAMIIARQDAELAAGPPSEMELRLLHATREVARLRARVRVEAEDVERAGVTWERARAWRDAHGVGSSLLCSDRESIAWYIGTQAVALQRCGLDILDEMAAMEVPS
jgi:hypothetical protein